MSNAEAPQREPVESVWRTAIGRSELEFGSLLHTPIREFLLSTDHIEALTKHRDKLGFQGAVAFFVAIFIAFLIHLNRSEISVSVTSPFGAIADLPVSLEVLLFALSVATSYYGVRFLSGVMLTKQMNTILNHLGYPSESGMMATEHVATRWSAMNLWSDLLMVRWSGYRSPRVHIAFVLLSTLLLVLIAFSQLAIILSATYAGIGQLAGGERPFAFWLIVVPSVVATHLGLLLPLFALCVPMKFSAQPLPEQQLQPTQEVLPIVPEATAAE